MASYELKISLEGAADVETTLKSLQGLTNSLSKPTKFGGGAGGAGGSPLSKIVSDSGKVEANAKGLKKHYQDAATAMAHGAKDAGTFLATALGGYGKKQGVAISKNVLSMMSEKDRAYVLSRLSGESFSEKAIKSKNKMPAKDPKDWGYDAWNKSFLKPGAFGADKIREMVAKSNLSHDKKANDALAQIYNPDWLKKITDPSTMKRHKKKSLDDANAFKMDMASLALPLFNPGSPWSTMWGAKNVFKGMNTEHGEAFRASKLGGMGAAAATALLVGGANAVGLAFKALTITVKQTVAAYENARQIYSKALQNGMGLQWSTKRGMLAQIMGVSEQDVFRFGAQMAYLNPKLEWASNILAKTATPLTAVSWEFKVLEADMSALFATMANDLAPAIKDFIIGLDGIVKTAKQLYEIQKNTPLGLWARLQMKIAQMEWKGIGYLTGQKDGKMPEAQAWMKQLPASHWEHMGLVVGSGAQNYGRETARNTKDMVKILKVISTAMTGNPNAAFGMSPNTAQP